MQAIFSKLIAELNGAVFILMAVLIIAFWVMYKFGGIVKTFSDFKDKNNELDKSISEIKDNLSSIKATTDLLYQAHLSTVKSHSPLSLSDRGIEFSTILNIEEKIALHWDAIIQEVEKRIPSNPYDVQTVCLDLAKSFFENIFSDEEKKEVKFFAYNQGVNLLEIYPIIGLIIRDKYLQEKGIDIKEIDQHDPSKHL